MADDDAKIRRALEIAQKTAGETCLSDETLGLFLDGAVGVEGKGTTITRAELESHLAGCLACQERMVALYRALQAVLDPAETIELAEKHFAGESASFEQHKQEREKEEGVKHDQEQDSLKSESEREDSYDGLGDVEERKG